MTKRNVTFFLVFLLAFALPLSELLAKDWYISAARGKGKKGTKEKPVADLGNIITKLQAGDSVHIAEGEYYGKGRCGVYKITVPVKVFGGYADDFSKRDPWGAHKTIFVGDNKTKNWKQGARFSIDLSKYRQGEVSEIIVDGLIVNQGTQNRYKTEKKQCILRKASPKKGENPTPDMGAIKVSVSRLPMRAPNDAFWKVTVQNCLVVNSAPTQGVISVAGYMGSKIFIRNNAIINNTGVGIYAMASYSGSADQPEFFIEENTVLFTWKYDAFASSFSGSSLKIDDDVLVTAKKNVFAFADRVGILKKGQEPLKWLDNFVVGNVGADYYEAAGDAKIAYSAIEDEAEYLHDDSEGFATGKITVPVSENFKKLYGSRVLIDRNAVEADIKAEKSNANALRGILGLPLQAADIKGVEGDVWLPYLAVDEAIKAATNKYNGYGCQKPEGNLPSAGTAAVPKTVKVIKGEIVEVIGGQPRISVDGKKMNWRDFGKFMAYPNKSFTIEIK